MANKKSPKKKKTTAKKKSPNKKSAVNKTSTSAKTKAPAKKTVKKEEVKDEKLVKKTKTLSSELKDSKKAIEKNPRKTKHKEAIAKESMRPKKTNKADLKRLKSSNSAGTDYETVKKFIIITVSIILTLVATYFLTNFIREVKKEQEAAEYKEIQNEEILASRIFDKADKEYYVVLYHMTNKENELLSVIISDYRQKEQLPIFEVDLDNILNKSIIADKDVSYEKDSFKIKETTLLHIKEGKILSHRDNDEDVIKFLKDKVITLIKN